jgi:WD40 repeat protein
MMLLVFIYFSYFRFFPCLGSADRTVKFWDLETFELIGSAGPEVFLCLLSVVLVESKVQIDSFRVLDSSYRVIYLYEFYSFWYALGYA